MRSQPTYPIYLQLSLLISSILSKKSLKKSKTDLFYLLSLLGPQSEALFLSTILRQIDFSDFRDEDDNEKPSRIRASLLLQRLEKIQDSAQILDVFPELLEDFALLKHLSISQAFICFCDSIRPSVRLQSILIISIIFTGVINPQLNEILLSKLGELFVQDPEKPLENLFHQGVIVDFLRKTPLLAELRGLFPKIIECRTEELNPEAILIENNPKYEKFVGIEFCLQPHELIEEFPGNPQEIVKIFQKNAFSEEELALCLASISKTYPVLEDSTQRLINRIFEGQGNPDTFPEKTQEKKTLNFNLESFMRLFAESSLKAAQILQKVDFLTFRSIFKDPKPFTNFLKLVQRFRKIYNSPFPLFLLFSRWKNPHSQIQFLISLFTNGGPDNISWNEIQHKKLISLDFNPNLRYQNLSPPVLQFWCCLEFLEILIESSETQYFQQIRGLFELPLSKTPDILIIGLSQIKPKCGQILLEDLFSSLFPLYLLNHSNSIPILEALWRYNEKLMIEAIYSLYKKENSSLNLSRVLDITQEIKDSLIPLTNCNFLNFSVSLGILASKREFLHFEHWLNERLRSAGNPFIGSLLKYIEENVIYPCEVFEKTSPNPIASFQNACLSILEKAQLSLETLGIIMESLLGSGFDKLSYRNQRKAQDLFSGVCKYFPPLAGVHESAKLEIENAANNYFQKYYYKEIKVEELIDLLAKLKSSNNPSDKEIYACVLHYLFDEFRHHDEYAPETLVMTGSIFGHLINSKMLDGSPLLEMALQCVRYCLEKGYSKRLEFAKEALLCFRKRIFDLFEFFQSLFYLDNIRDKISDLLFDLYEDARKGGRPFEIKPELLFFLQSQHTPIFTKTFETQKILNFQLGSVKPLQYPAKIAIPSSESFINISEFINKQNEETEPVEEEVMNQLTFHLNSLCPNNLLEKSNELRKILEKNENVQKWFSRTLVFKRVIQETLTKNNYLQLLNQLQLKSLYKSILRETFSCINKLLNLQVCANEKAASQVKTFLKNLGFWLGHLTLARNKPIIMKHLNLKILLTEAVLNNRVNIIVPFICKILEASKNSEVFDLNNPWIKAILQMLHDILKNEDFKQTVKQEIKLLFNSLEIDGKSFEKTQSTEGFSAPRPLNSTLEPTFLNVSTALLSRYAQKLPKLREMIQKVLSKNVNELLIPVISRTVTIALITGKKLAGKDFAFDFSDIHYERGTMLIVQNLAYSLALATAKEPLKNKIQTDLTAELQSSGLAEQELEDILETVNAENFDNAVNFIQRKVVEKALFELSQDNDVRDGIDKRKLGGYQPEESYFKSIETLPKLIKPDMKGLSDDEFRIYEEFNKEERDDDPIEFQAANDKNNLMMTWLAMAQSLDSRFEELSDSDLNSLMNNFREFWTSSPGLPESLALELALIFLQLAVNKGRKLDILLKSVQFLSQGVNAKRVLKEIKTYLLNLQDVILADHSKFNETLLLSLFSLKLLNEKNLDKVCGALLKRPILNVQNSVVKTLNTLVFNSKQITPKDCLLSSVALGSIDKSNELVNRFLENLNKFSSFTVRTSKKAEVLEFLEKKGSLYERIVSHFQAFRTEKVKEEEFMVLEGWITRESEDVTVKTLAVLIDLCCSNANESIVFTRKIGVSDMDFSSLDLFKQLLVQILSRTKEKSRILENFLDAFEIVLIIAQKYENGLNQRPFTRLIRLLIEDYPRKVDSNPLEFYFLLVKKLMELSPTKFPAFVIGWIELIGHYLLVPSLLAKEELHYSYHLLLVELMRFFRKLLNDEEAKKSTAFKMCYFASLKIMLLLLHDFPEFLAVFSINLCNEIPESFVQIRNIVLAAFPKNMRLIDPFQISDVKLLRIYFLFLAKVNKIENFKEMPKIFFKDFEDKIQDMQFHVDIYEFMNGRKEGIISQILEKFRGVEGTTEYQAVNAFVIGVPWILYSNKQAKSNPRFWENKAEAESLLFQVLKKANCEIREALINSAMNQIRYPNLLSYFFINLILGLFNDRSFGVLREQIARVIVERLIVEKPHPWGLMFTFIELIRNPAYSFKEIFSEGLFKVIIERIFNSLNMS